MTGTVCTRICGRCGVTGDGCGVGGPDPGVTREVPYQQCSITLECARMEYRVEGTGTDTDWAHGSPRSIKRGNSHEPFAEISRVVKWLLS
jgi:hypothetical protein